MSKTILVTRAKGDEHELAEALQELGHAVIHEPLTEIFLNHTMRAHIELLRRGQSVFRESVSRRATGPAGSPLQSSLLWLAAAGGATNEI